MASCCIAAHPTRERQPRGPHPNRSRSAVVGLAPRRKVDTALAMTDAEREARTWNNGDVINVTMPAVIALDRTPDSPTVQSVRFGGIVLAGGFATTDLIALPVPT